MLLMPFPPNPTPTGIPLLWRRKLGRPGPPMPPKPDGGAEGAIPEGGREFMGRVPGIGAGAAGAAIGAWGMAVGPLRDGPLSSVTVTRRVG